MELQASIAGPRGSKNSYRTFDFCSGCGCVDVFGRTAMKVIDSTITIITILYSILFYIYNIILYRP